MGRTTIKEYVKMPKVEIDGSVFVDKEIFVGYAINLLQQDLDDTFSEDEKSGIEIAMKRLLEI